MATTQAGLDAAYSTEINNCTFNADLGVRFRSRPQSFCDSVTISKTLDVASTATFAVPINVTTAVIVDGVSYMPSTITGLGANGQLLTANGVPIVLTAPPPSSGTFSNLTVTGTATLNNITFTGAATGILNAGSY